METSLVIIKPVMSEKSSSMNEEAKPKYMFWVARDANKPMVSKAVEEMFGVKPVKVHIQNVFGKWKRVRRDYGLTPTMKKAIVTLKHGDKLDLFESK